MTYLPDQLMEKPDQPIETSARLVLIADDDPDLVEMLRYVLLQQGYRVHTAADGWQVLQSVKEQTPDLILMDVMMPGMDGIETTRQLREMPSLNQTRIVMLTARAEEYTQVAAFQSGADAFLTKPIKPRALISRLQALFRRVEPSESFPAEQLVLGDLLLDKNAYTVTKAGKKVDLPRKEFDLFYFLVAHPNQVYSREQLLGHIWKTSFVGDRTVDVHVRKLREKIGEGYLTTVKGVGYVVRTKSVTDRA
jgi:two-component system alkaline phosphatase synthesis response regulator PhoP